MVRVFKCHPSYELQLNDSVCLKLRVKNNLCKFLAFCSFRITTSQKAFVSNTIWHHTMWRSPQAMRNQEREKSGLNYELHTLKILESSSDQRDGLEVSLTQDKVAIVKIMVGDGRSAKGIQAPNAENKTNEIGRKLRNTEGRLARVDNEPEGWSEHVHEQTFTHIRIDT